MSTATLEKKMGRKKSETPRDDTTVKVERAIVDKAKLVVLRKGTTLAELLSDLLRDPIDALYEQEVASLTQRPKGPKPKR